MESYYYYTPPDPEAGHYQQYQYAVGNPLPYAPPAPFVHDPTIANGDNDANPEGGNDQAQEPPTDAAAAQKEHPPTSPPRTRKVDSKVDAVYRKAPTAPKRFKSAYVHFFRDFVAKKKAEVGPDGEPFKFDIRAHSRECSQAWKELPVDQKQYWESVSEKEKEEYNKQKDAYDGPWRIATSKVKKRKKGAPKRSPSAFFLFVKVKRPEVKEKHPDMVNTEVIRACSAMWKKMSDSDKAPYKEEEKTLRAKYHIEAEKWKKQCEEKKGQDESEDEDDSYVLAASHGLHLPGYDPNSGVIRSKKRRKDPFAPKRSPPAFFLFVNHCRPELKAQFPDMKNSELVKMLGQKWAQMSDEDKEPFRNHEAMLRQQYHIDNKRYKKGAVTEDEALLASVTKSPVMKGTPEKKEPSMVPSPERRFDYQQPTEFELHDGELDDEDDDLGFVNYFG